jgi:hypothetical protein
VTVKRHGTELLCQLLKIPPEVIAKMVRKGCVSDKMGGQEDEDDAGNVGSEHENVRQMVEMLRWNKG